LAAADDPKPLKPYYDKNPNHLVAIRQLPKSTGWCAFPGDNGIKITDVIKNHLQSIMAQKAKRCGATADGQGRASAVAQSVLTRHLPAQKDDGRRSRCSLSMVEPQPGIHPGLLGVKPQDAVGDNTTEQHGGDHAEREQLGAVHGITRRASHVRPRAASG
jgi:hypothetical protein